jgi:RNA polymerase sigma factor (TIGR02999 family)
MSADRGAPGPGPRVSPAGESGVADRHFEEVYSHLRALAGSYLRSERPGHTLQPTAVVNEAYLRLRGATPDDLCDRGHFLAVASRAMRQVLIDSARRQLADKRRRREVTLEEDLLGTEPRPLDVLALDRALEELAGVDEQRARIVELRFFAGLSCEETADVLGVSPRTVVRQWRSSRAFLLRRLR